MPVSEETDRDWRRTCRKVAAALVGMMADLDMGPQDIAARLGRRPKTVERWLDRLIDGREEDLRPAHDMARALYCRLRVELDEIGEIATPPAEPAPAE